MALLGWVIRWKTLGFVKHRETNSKTCSARCYLLTEQHDSWKLKFHQYISVEDKYKEPQSFRKPFKRGKLLARYRRDYSSLRFVKKWLNFKSVWKYLSLFLTWNYPKPLVELTPYSYYPVTIWFSPFQEEYPRPIPDFPPLSLRLNRVGYVSTLSYIKKVQFSGILKISTSTIKKLPLHYYEGGHLKLGEV